MNRKLRGRRGFTLVELLVVIAIIGILVALLLPAVQAAREAARRMQCGNNIKQLGIALHNYHDTYKTFPPDAIWHGNPKGTTSAPGTQRNYTWICLILPFIEQGPLHDKIDFAQPAFITGGGGQLQIITTGSGGETALEFMLPSLQCPSDPAFNSPPRGVGITSYAGNAGWDHHRRKHRDTWRAGVFTFYDNTRLRDIVDGTSNTIAIGEVTTRGYCCRPAPTNDTRWQGGSGRLRHASQSVSRAALLATSAHSGWNHAWVNEENKGDVLRADGSAGALWGVWTSPNHIHPPTYYAHYSMNVEWPAPGSVHPGGAQYGLSDASVRFIPQTITVGNAPTSYGTNGNVWFALQTIEGHPAETQVVLP
jgi:prepilin-type N-terminal cleavage/methylation domain-containing protein